MLVMFAIVLELLGRLVGSTSIAIAAAAALGAVIADSAMTPRLDGVSVTRVGPARLTVGVESRVQLVLTQTSPHHRGLAPVLLTDDHPALTVTRVMTPPLPRGGRTVLELRVTPQHRGHWTSARTTVEAHSPLGGFVRRRTFTVADATWVHPAPAAPLAVADTSLAAPDGAVDVSRRGHDTGFYGIREWRSGDSAGTVHWRASARHNQLVVMERERRAGAPLVVVVGPATAGPRWELAVARAAATAVAVQRAGRLVTLVTGESATTATNPIDLLDWFAALDEVAPADNVALNRSLHRGGAGAALLWVADAGVPASLSGLARSAGATVTSVAQGSGPGEAG